MARKLILTLLCIFTCCGYVRAQEDKTAEINKIKKNSHYLYTTGTSMISMAEASKNAEIMLSAEVERWLDENTKEDVAGYIAKWKEKVSVIETKRGTVYRSFAYVNKKDILPRFEGENIVADLNTNDTITEIVKVPSGNDSALQETKIETIQEKDSITNNTSQIEVIPLEEVKKFDNVTIPAEAPIPNEVIMPNEVLVLDEINSKEINRDLDTTPVVDSSVEIVPIYGGKKDSEEEKKMLELSTRSELQNYLTSLKRRDKYLSSYDITDIPTHGTAYLLILDYHGIIRKCICINNGIPCDMATKEDINIEDVLNKYSTGSKICFTIK